MTRHSRIILFFVVLVFWACAVNPVTQKKEFILLSEEDEIEIGRQAHQEIKKEYGIYKELEGLGSYVSKVGSDLAKVSDRPDMPYRFKVLDSGVINAFALPGGYVYVTRGILARMSSEDELAAVLGHEMAHVTHRHGAARYSKAMATQLLLGLAALLSPEAMENYGGAVDTGIGLAFLGYSRGQEEEADRSGLAYARSAGYNPRGAVKLFKMFLAMEDHEPGAMERWLMSHPPTQERLDYAQQVLAENPSGKGADVFRKKAYLKAIDGLHLGDGKQGKVEAGGRFYDKNARLRLTVPDGFSTHLNASNAEALFLHQTKAEGGSDRVLSTIVALQIRPLKQNTSLGNFVDAYIEKRGGTKVRPRNDVMTADGQRPEVRVFEKTGKMGDEKLLVSFLKRGGEVVVLRGIEQLPNLRVAEMLGERPTTIAMRYRRALERLRAELPGSVFTEFSGDSEESM